MNGLKIFSHSFRQVSGNLNMALRVSGGFWLLMMAASFVLGLIIALTQSAFLAGILGIAVVVFLVWGISMVAVVWHRYILLEELPSGFLPAKPGLRIWPYFWYGLAIAFFVVLTLAILYFAATITVDPRIIYHAFDQTVVANGPSDIAVRFAVGLVSSIIYLRLALILPAVALDESLTLGESWSETKPFAGSIIILAILLSVLNGGATYVFEVARLSVFGSGALLLIVTLVTLAFQWFYFMLNISILSTLYGHIVQKREVH